MHCYVEDNNIESNPCPPSCMWRANIGTNLTIEEVNMSLKGRYKVERKADIGKNPMSKTTRSKVGSSSSTPNNTKNTKD